MNKIKKLFLINLTILLLVVGWFCGSNAESVDTSGLKIYFLDVGEGDAAVIICDNEVMMIDGGNTQYSSFVYSFLRNTLSISEINIMIASHPHADHVGGLAAALNACPVDVLYTPIIEYDTKAWNSVLKYAKAQGTPILIPEIGEQLTLGKATIEFLGPIFYHCDTNNLSLIVKIVYGNTSFLFTGDAEWDEEHDLLEVGKDISADVLKVGHHGSKSSTSYRFLRKVSPGYAVISVGARNQYGHPDEVTLSRLEDAGIIVYRTDLNGTIECCSDGSIISFK